MQQTPEQVLETKDLTPEVSTENAKDVADQVNSDALDAIEDYNSTKELVKSFAVKADQEVLVKVPGKVTFKPWEESFMRLETTITANVSESTLNQLIKAWRYEPEQMNTEKWFSISLPKLEKSVAVWWLDLEDKTDYIVYVPSAMYADGKFKAENTRLPNIISWETENTANK